MDTTIDTSTVLTVSQAAEIAGVSTKTIRRWLHSGRDIIAATVDVVGVSLAPFPRFDREPSVFGRPGRTDPDLALKPRRAIG